MKFFINFIVISIICVFIPGCLFEKGYFYDVTVQIDQQIFDTNISGDITSAELISLSRNTILNNIIKIQNIGQFEDKYRWQLYPPILKSEIKKNEANGGLEVNFKNAYVIGSGKVVEQPVILCKMDSQLLLFEVVGPDKAFVSKVKKRKNGYQIISERKSIPASLKVTVIREWKENVKNPDSLLYLQVNIQSTETGSGRAERPNTKDLD